MKYLIEGNRESKNYNRDDYNAHSYKERRNVTYHVPHFLTPQLNVIWFSFFLFHLKSVLVSQFQLILHKVIVCPSLGGQSLMVAYLNHLTLVDDHDLAGILHRA